MRHVVHVVDRRGDVERSSPSAPILPGRARSLSATGRTSRDGGAARTYAPFRPHRSEAGAARPSRGWTGTGRGEHREIGRHRSPHRPVGPGRRTRPSCARFSGSARATCSTSVSRTAASCCSRSSRSARSAAAPTTCSTLHEKHVCKGCVERAQPGLTPRADGRRPRRSATDAEHRVVGAALRHAEVAARPTRLRRARSRRRRARRALACSTAGSSTVGRGRRQRPTTITCSPARGIGRGPRRPRRRRGSRARPPRSAS